MPSIIYDLVFDILLVPVPGTDRWLLAPGIGRGPVGPGGVLGPGGVCSGSSQHSTPMSLHRWKKCGKNVQWRDKIGSVSTFSFEHTIPADRIPSRLDPLKSAVCRLRLERQTFFCCGLFAVVNIVSFQSKMFHDMFHDMFQDMFVHWSGLRRALHENPICFTICLFISPDLDGHPIQP
jgi:hypothetical protein